MDPGSQEFGKQVEKVLQMVSIATGTPYGTMLKNLNKNSLPVNPLSLVIEAGPDASALPLESLTSTALQGEKEKDSSTDLEELLEKGLRDLEERLTKKLEHGMGVLSHRVAVLEGKFTFHLPTWDSLAKLPEELRSHALRAEVSKLREELTSLQMNISYASPVNINLEWLKPFMEMQLSRINGEFSSLKKEMLSLMAPALPSPTVLPSSVSITKTRTLSTASLSSIEGPPLRIATRPQLPCGKAPTSKPSASSTPDLVRRSECLFED